jgi:AGCS family alanine or glycine:cation symporter
MLEKLELLALIKHNLAIYCIVPVVFLSGLYFSFTLKFIQFRKIITAIKHTVNPSDNKGQGFSSFGALAAVLGGNLGTGNIAGIAVALTTGGPGSLFWMTIMVVFGMVIKFCCCFLGVRYREQDSKNNWVGGPMYYLAKGLNSKYLSKIFCILTICAAVTTGNFIQIHSITLPLNQARVSPLIVALVVAVFVAIVMIGGVKRFSRMVISVVPFMALFYMFACISILFAHKDLLLPSLKLIWSSAFDIKALGGAGLGFTLQTAIRVGFDRGIMATDTGIGIAPILHSQVSQDKLHYRDIAMQQGLISMLAPIVVLLVCMLTGLVLLVTNVWQMPLESTSMCLAAFKIGLSNGDWAAFVVNVTLCLFAFTTILTWAYCAESAVQYLCKDLKNHKYVLLFRYLFVAIIPLGVFFEVRVLWNLADLFLNFMLLINMYAICRLFKYILIDLNINKQNINKQPDSIEYVL